jgi:hypothetical protein
VTSGARRRSASSAKEKHCRNEQACESPPGSTRFGKRIQKRAHGFATVAWQVSLVEELAGPPHELLPVRNRGSGEAKLAAPSQDSSCNRVQTEIDSYNRST